MLLLTMNDSNNTAATWNAYFFDGALRLSTHAPMTREAAEAWARLRMPHGRGRYCVRDDGPARGHEVWLA